MASRAYMVGNRPKEPQGQVVPWRLTRETWYKFLEILKRWEQYPPNSEPRAALENDIRSLPNFPTGYDTERDEIQPVITDMIIPIKGAIR